jgi:hypothetical protein
MEKSSEYLWAKPEPSPEGGALPICSHTAQFDAGAAPSDCVEDAAVPQMKSVGKFGGIQSVSFRGTPCNEADPGSAARVCHYPRGTLFVPPVRRRSLYVELAPSPLGCD